MDPTTHNTEVIDRLVRAYNDHDPRRFANLFTPDATHGTLRGETPQHGREAIYEHYVGKPYPPLRPTLGNGPTMCAKYSRRLTVDVVARAPRRSRVNRRPTMANTSTSLVPANADDPLDARARGAIAGFLAGYSGATLVSYRTDLRLFATWCVSNRLQLLEVKRAHIEIFGR
jgi:hypothetical protein